MRNAFITAIAVIVSLGLTEGASAQSTRRPDLNLFKRGLRDPRQSLGVQGNLGLSFYDAIGRHELPEGAIELPDHGWGSFGSVALQYGLKLGRVSFDGTLGGYASYYPGSPKPLRTKWFPGAGARTGYEIKLDEKSTLTLSGELRYRPLFAETVTPDLGFNFGSFGGGSVGPSFAPGSDPNTAFLPNETAFVGGSYLATSAGATVARQLTRRWGVSGSYRYEHDYAIGGSEQPGFGGVWRHDAGAAAHFAVTPKLSVRMGYRVGETHAEGQPPFRSHSADLGVDYGDGLVIQLTRQTRLSFTGGMSAYVDRTGDQHYRATGSAQLSHALGRTWSSGAFYQRGVDTGSLVFREPVLTDTAGGYLNGNIGRRLGVHANVSAQGGVLALGSSNRSILRTGANVGVQSSLGRHFALGVDYVYYQYRFDSAVVLPTGVPRKNANQGVYAFVSAWAPIFQSGGRNATR
jgi:hypothetical protein